MSIATVKVFLGGEGNNELGRFSEGAPGVLEALLRRVREAGWNVDAVLPWRQIRKYAARPRFSAEQRNVLGLALAAHERGCEILAFSRDAADVHDDDGDYDVAVAHAREVFSTLTIIGGLAKPTLEGWVLAAIGHPNTDELSKRKAISILQQEVGRKDTDAFAESVRNSTSPLPDRGSLGAWVRDARGAFLKHIG